MHDSISHIRIISRSADLFTDRAEAGERLASELQSLKESGTVVIGIPRGGIVVAKIIASRLGAELDIALCRKIGAPFNPELAIGAIAENGIVFLDDQTIADLGTSQTYLEAEKEHQFGELKRRIAFYRKIKPKRSLAGKPAIVVDDGIATGATMQAALWSVREERPSTLIAAVPVGAEESLFRLAQSADEIICLYAPKFFGAVGQFYSRFEQVSDEEVVRLLKETDGTERTTPHERRDDEQGAATG